ncbi:hypothetical protein GCM10009821_14370 [Aeromicrobium halocynthiae]|uniref:Helix-hairpin-helix DNA-binding motif class 1 domain-containing protein n=1 Tax=Aeromicrobium halocynthiae TaxID=560557 RepID=A0ABN2VX92_9ACTN
MNRGWQDDAGETRAEIARRRLAQLDASFRAQADPPVAEHAGTRTGAGAGADTGTDVLDADEASGRPSIPFPTDRLRSPGEPAMTAPGRRSHRADPQRPRPILLAAHLRLVAAAAVAAGVLLTWWVLAERPELAEEHVDLTAPAASGTQEEQDGSQVAETTDEVIVDVAGKVKRPGIVVLPAGARVHEAIEAAGGLDGTVDTTSLNLARELSDGEQVLVGVEPAPSATGTSPGGPGSGGGGSLVNLNAASLEELQSLPGVGPVTAQSILTWREENGRFASVDDLLQVSGIGEKTLATLRDLVSV